MIPRNLSKTVQKTIAKGETDEAIKVLGRSKTIKNDPKLLQIYNLISAQWNKYKTEKNQNIRREDDQNRTLNQIHLSILELVDGDLSALEQAPQNSSPIKESGNTALKYFIYGIIFFLIIWGGMEATGMLSPEPYTPPRTNTSSKPVLRAFKIYIIDNNGVRTNNVHIAKIYQDYTGEITIGGRKHILTKIVEADRDQMEFYFQNNGLYHYKYMLPSLADAQAGRNTNSGIVLFNNQQIASWRAEEMSLN
ncbi:MAG: hypothetical protein AB8G15_11465 [Saprospiraceae bacterium]